MIFKLHYWCVAAGFNALGILLGVFMEHYTDATAAEIGLLFMIMPFTGIVFRPLICSLADRHQAHQRYLIVCLLIAALGYLPYVVIPCLGPAAYEQHPRICWYILVVMKVMGDVAFGGVISIGDSLAINYAKRINVNFSVYRVWGTLSWMFFGVVTGQVNEVAALPKYVPGFIILIAATLLDMVLVWLWPREYFTMVPHGDKENAKDKEQPDSEGKLSAMTKSLMPRQVVWAHAKRKLLSLVSCSCFSLEDEQQQQPNSVGGETEIKLDAEIKKHQPDTPTINKMTQLKILCLLLRRDPRIIWYLLMFVCAGATVTPLYFLFMSLSNVCHENDRCHFSQLAGFLQVSMAASETVTFIVVGPVLRCLGRLNTISISFALTAIKYAIYGSVFYSIEPYYALLIELFHGIIFGIFITITVESGHMFANEVQLIIPELIRDGTIAKDQDQDKLKLSLAATMQALIASAMDGIGRAFSSIIYGFILHHFGYGALWLTVSASSLLVTSLIVLSSLCDSLFGLKLAPIHRKLAVEASC